MTLEDEIAEELAKEISEEIDFDIMKDLLTDSGWYTVQLLTLGSREKSIDIKDWVTKNCKRGFVSRGRTFIFKSKKEAEWFSLRWL
jgi:NTP pyrophosphatase (non-canonical NTP hydrolase)